MLDANFYSFIRPKRKYVATPSPPRVLIGQIDSNHSNTVTSSGASSDPWGSNIPDLQELSA